MANVIHCLGWIHYAFISLIFCSSAIAAQRPHIVVFISDDHGYLDLSLHDQPGFRAFTIVDDPAVELSELSSDSVTQIVERQLSPQNTWEFPAASVTAVDVRFEA
jgi:hypothetical protein